MTRKGVSTLRSPRWFAPDDVRSFGHRSRLMQMGYGADDRAGKPVIAIVNTWSDANPCHTHFKQRVEDVKRGVVQAGGLPLELPAISLSEPIVTPTTMLYRNFLAMETEELLQCHPVGGAVLMGGRDKTTPGLTMGAISAGVPFVYLPAGPMLRGHWKGQVLGSGSDAFKYLGLTSMMLFTATTPGTCAAIDSTGAVSPALRVAPASMTMPCSVSTVMAAPSTAGLWAMRIFTAAAMAVSSLSWLGLCGSPATAQPDAANNMMARAAAPRMGECFTRWLLARGQVNPL